MPVLTKKKMGARSITRSVYSPGFCTKKARTWNSNMEVNVPGVNFNHQTLMEVYRIRYTELNTKIYIEAVNK